MDPIARMVAAGAAGAAGAADATYVDDVFSTFLYEGTGAAHTITNGIDLSGEGGLVWIKNRQLSGGLNHSLYDTERGVLRQLVSNSTSGQGGASGNDLDGFNSDGFSLGTDTYSIVNADGYDYASWTFRKAPGFFDIVTYTGNSSNRTIAHNLGSVPGMIIVKQYDATRQWFVYHRSLGATYSINLDSNAGKQLGSTIWNNTEPTATHFSLGTSAGVNNNNNQYIAYIFAHDDQSFGTNSDEAIVKCGSYTGNGSSDGPEVNLGFEPQFILHKRTGNADNWAIFDNMRGFPKNEALFPDTSDAEVGFGDTMIRHTSTGFKITTTNSFFNSNNETYIYMAIRRPHKPPTAGTDVFKAVQTTSQPFSVGFPTDLNINAMTGAGNASKYWVPRLTNNYMQSNNNLSESSGSADFKFDLQNSFSTGSFWGSTQTINWQFRRAPGFFDVVAYAGNGADNHQITHNLGVVPEFALFKKRTNNDSWVHFHDMNASTYFYSFFNTGPGTAQSYGSGYRMFAQPNATTLFLSDYATMNQSGQDYICYLFASLDGISKIGTYSGTGSNIDVDCGFTAGARFVLIKNISSNSNGDWYVWDTTRGIVSGNDPYILLNSTADQVTNTDYIDPLNAGFTVTSSAPAELNTSGGTYLFLAIA